MSLQLLGQEAATSSICLEISPTLCATGQQLASEAGLPLTYRVADVLSLADEDLPYLVGSGPALHVALHACGGLHRRMVRGAVAARAAHVAVAPCCFHKHPPQGDGAAPAQLLSARAARASQLVISWEELRLASASGFAAKRRDENLRTREITWRLAFAAWHRRVHAHVHGGNRDAPLVSPNLDSIRGSSHSPNLDCSGLESDDIRCDRSEWDREDVRRCEDDDDGRGDGDDRARDGAYGASVEGSFGPGAVRLPSVPKLLLSQGDSTRHTVDGFRAFCKWAVSAPGKSASSRAWLALALEEHLTKREASLCLELGAAQAARLARLELVRHAYQRPLEQWLCLDVALYLEESGYSAEVRQLCERSVSPRNLLVCGERLGNL